MTEQNTQQQLDTLNRELEAVLTVLGEFDDGTPVPASSIYLAIGSDMTKYEQLVGILGRGGAIERTDDAVELTDKGRDLVAEIRKCRGSLNLG